MSMERTVVILKPDAFERGLVGDILSRFELVGLRIAGSKTLKVSREFVAQHYPDDKEYLKSVGVKTIASHTKRGDDVAAIFGSTDPAEIGQKIRHWNMDYLSKSPVIAFVLEGDSACITVRRLVGHTNPADADPGTIRSDYSNDSFDTASKENRSVRNLVHASENAKEADKEIKLWFKKEELV